MCSRQGLDPGGQLPLVRSDQDESLVDGALLDIQQSAYSQRISRVTTQAEYSLGGIGNNAARLYPASCHAQPK